MANRTIVIHIAQIPPSKTSQQKGVRAFVDKSGKPRTQFFEKKAVKEELDILCSAMAPHCPETPIRGPISLAVTFVYPWRKEDVSSATKKESALLLGAEWKITKPDTDNLVKGIKDRMARLMFFHDDAQIAEELVRKFHGGKVGVWIVIKELGWRRDIGHGCAEQDS